MSRGCAIGLDLGGTKMSVCALDGQHTVLHRATAPTCHDSVEELLAQLESSLREAHEACPEAEAIGIGTPSTIDRERGCAISSVNLPIVGVPLRELITTRLGMPAFIDNDANLAALAEHRFGAAKGATNAVVLTIGTGIGGGLILGGELYRGSVGAGGELGHVVIDEDGPPCQGNCPNRGCLEVLASGTALGRQGRIAAETHPGSALGRALAAGDEIAGRTVTEAATAGDRIAVDVVATIGRRLGVALSSLANMFNPDMIVVGGGVIGAGELLLGPAREELRACALPPQDRTVVCAATLGTDAGVVGAATMALEESRAGNELGVRM